MAEYSCKKCDSIVEDTSYISQKDGYMINMGCWFYCKECDEHIQKVNING